MQTAQVTYQLTDRCPVNPEARKKWAKTLSKRKNRPNFAGLDQLQPGKFEAATIYLPKQR